MKREILEETGLSIDVEDLNLSDTTYVDYGDVKFNYIIYKLKLTQLPQITINPLEHQDYRFVSPQKALEIGLLKDQDFFVKREYGI